MFMRRKDLYGNANSVFFFLILVAVFSYSSFWSSVSYKKNLLQNYFKVVEKISGQTEFIIIF